ncbi:MAG: hypothetical protein IJC65_04290 [Oscillospiraceae bacterium]|nr:hypothetical protein [Oscillospiraceae bacterium]
MKNKLKKTFAAALAALTMTTAMAGTASATTYTKYWRLKRVPSSSGYLLYSTDILEFTPDSDKTSIQVNCPTFSSTETANGTIATVRYRAQAKGYDREGNVIETYTCFNYNYFQQIRTDMKTINFVTPYTYGDTLFVNFELQNYSSVVCNFGGKVIL